MSTKTPPSFDVPQHIIRSEWEEFFRAARGMVARTTPGLLALWDFNAGIMALYAEARQASPPYDGSPSKRFTILAYIAEEFGLPALLTIMERPQAAAGMHRKLQAGRALTAQHVGQYDAIKHRLTLCRSLRRRHGKTLGFDPTHPPWSEGVRVECTAPRGRGKPPVTMRMDSPDFYRLLLSDLCDSTAIPEHTLKNCARLWNVPAQAAWEIMEHLTARDRDNLSKRLASLRSRYARTRR